MKTDNNAPSKLNWHPDIAWMGNRLGYVKGSSTFLLASNDKLTDEIPERKN